MASTEEIVVTIKADGSHAEATFKTLTAQAETLIARIKELKAVMAELPGLANEDIEKIANELVSKGLSISRSLGHRE